MRYVLNIDPRLKMADEMVQKFWDLPVYVGFQGEINPETAKKFIENMSAAENAAIKAGQKVLPVIVNSGGGCLYSTLGMIDAIKDCSLTVATVVESKAMSAGAWIFSCGAEGHRYIAPSATIMIHTVTLSRKGKMDEIKASTKEGERLNKMMFREMSANCGQHDTYFEDILKKEHTNTEWFLDPQDAIKHNLANKIGTPSMTTTVTYDHKFE